jgi:hypothetical protein
MKGPALARYREKTPDEIAWNDLRRRLTRSLDTEIAAFREVVLNKLLTGAFDEYTKSLESGEQIVLENNVAAWIGDAMTQVLTPRVEALDIGAMDREPPHQ